MIPLIPGRVATPTCSDDPTRVPCPLVRDPTPLHRPDSKDPLLEIIVLPNVIRARIMIRGIMQVDLSDKQVDSLDIISMLKPKVWAA
ncbi:UNVERIFIED_CONTAM: hypothetical protein Sradi_3350300 [Sesamum radiatum]|uniref:Uncharacterized protein n=1 Tax=Sesamum radiatum TaxID=300843 RepID=A0AAW2R2S8_SESRA